MPETTRWEGTTELKAYSLESCLGYTRTPLCIAHRQERTKPDLPHDATGITRGKARDYTVNRGIRDSGKQPLCGTLGKT